MKPASKAPARAHPSPIPMSALVVSFVPLPMFVGEETVEVVLDWDLV